MTVSRVRLEFKRIQTYLFAIPRLRTILGANALVGEVLRLRLPELAAQWQQHVLPSGLQAPAPTDWPRASEGAAALRTESDTGQPWVADDPDAAYRAGVLTRDGGHFQALFPNLDSASGFAHEAAALLAADLPGLLTELHLESWAPSPGDAKLVQGWKAQVARTPPPPVADPDLFVDQVCALSGQGAATHTLEVVQKGRRQQMRVSWQAVVQWGAGDRFRSGRTQDIVGRLQNMLGDDRQPLLPCRGGLWREPRDLEDLAGGGGRYLALVHADGNGVGSRGPVKLVTESPTLPDEPAAAGLQRWLDLEAGVEAFYASMRQTVRAALVEALWVVFGKMDPGSGQYRPYQLLMLGGDDLLLTCRAECALPFVRAYAEALADRNLSDQKPLDIGVGVAIARSSYPFVGLHAKCEELADSAKRLARGLPEGGPGRSVVDWAVITASTMDELSAHRRRHDRLAYSVNQNGAEVTEVLALSARPYFVLEPPVGSTRTLAKLLDTANALRANRSQVARSQLKSLPASLRLGRIAGEFAVQDLPEPILELLGEHKLEKAWWPVAATPSPDAASSAVHRYLTPLVDLVEVVEMAQLGRRPPRQLRDEAEASPGTTP